MTTAEEVLRAARERLHVVPANGDPTEDAATESEAGGRANYELVITSKGAPKTEPKNVRWLRSQLGHRHLPWAFLRSGRVVKVSGVGENGYQQPAHSHDDNGPATVAALTGRSLSTLLADAVYCYVIRETDKGKKYDTEEWFPESDCARALDQPDLLPFLRPLRGVTHTPLPRAGRGMLATPGYDVESGYLYQSLGPVPQFPASPTPDQARAAAGRILNLVGEFTWAGDHDKANYIGGLLTPLMRLATPPPYKMIAIGAHQRGSGKSLLAQIYRIVHGGTLRGWPGSEEELKKQITSILSQTTAPVCQLDNIRGLLRSATLEALLTSPEYTDRVLGTSNDTVMKNDRLWVATGNNMVLGGDMDRRVVWVTIDPGVERPEDRNDFTIKDLAAFVTHNRVTVLGDLLTMLAAWDAAGRPTDPPTSSDCFAAWTAAIRGVLTVCGVPGTFDATESRSDVVDPDAEESAAFLAAVHARFGDAAWTAKDITAAMVDPAGETFGTQRPQQTPGESDDDFAVRIATWTQQVQQKAHGVALAETYPTAARGKFWRPGTSYAELTKPLGYWLRHRMGQWFDGRRVVKAHRGRGGAEYRVVRAEASGVAL